MAETLGQVKRQFGSGAVILNTRTLTKGGLLGIGGKSYVEITAVREMADLPIPLRRGTLKGRSGETGRADGAAKTVSPAPAAVSSSPSDDVLAEVRDLKAAVASLIGETRRAQAPDIPEALYGTYQRLVENEVAEQLARQLVARVYDELTPDQLRSARAVRNKLAALLESFLPVAGPIRCPRSDRPAMIALIGPTGVGKTTTIAKLAASFCLREHRKVGLITVDTYRIAAVEQLKTYAEIIDVPLEVADTPARFGEAVTRLADREVILMDTAGRSQRDEGKMAELREFFSVAKPDEVHLVLSSACGEAVLADTVERFREFGIDRVILTKLDEAIGFGVILTCLEKANAGLSYVTTGQDVPDDIEVGETSALVDLILRDRASSDQVVWTPARAGATTASGRSLLAGGAAG